MDGVRHGVRRRWAVVAVLAAVLGVVGWGPVQPVPKVAAAPVTPVSPMRVAYGSQPDMFGDLYLPPRRSGSAEKCPVVVLFHGGGWLRYLSLRQFAAHASELADAGVAVWNVEYRRVNGGGGYPTTLTDADAAVGALSTVVQRRAGGRLDLDQVHLAGHSAGGQLAAWTAGRRTAGVSAGQGVRIRSLTLMASVLDMGYAASHGRDPFVPKLLGGTPETVPDRYRFASPIDNLPRDIHITAVQGTADRLVSVQQTSRYMAAAGRANRIETHILPGVGHTPFTDVHSPAWATAREAILAQVRGKV
ncbi:MAG: alpha/beta fold hydrolase [Nocardia sp.]|nr:alpha/beta fold hydrolase [Nocardia sp.]